MTDGDTGGQDHVDQILANIERLPKKMQGLTHYLGQLRYEKSRIEDEMQFQHAETLVDVAITKNGDKPTYPNKESREAALTARLHKSEAYQELREQQRVLQRKIAETESTYETCDAEMKTARASLGAIRAQMEREAAELQHRAASMQYQADRHRWKIAQELQKLL